MVFTAAAKKTSPSLESFEETYKTAYSHGLEAIYSLTSVDLKTVRKIELPEQAVPSKQEKSPCVAEELASPQLAFDFGAGFREWIAPLFLQEPLQVLALSHQAQSCLLDHGFQTISQLLENNFSEKAFRMGVKQGHIAEVQNKLQDYVNGRSVRKTDLVDFPSLALGFMKGVSSKKFALLLQEFQIFGIVPLSLAEASEIKALDRNKKAALAQEMRAELREETRRQEALARFADITKAFILPWMARRCCLATTEEIVERLERIASSSQNIAGYLRFLADAFLEGKWFFSPFAVEVEEGVFCRDETTAAVYRKVLGEAVTYFYKPGIRYPLHAFIALLQKQFIKQWADIEPTKIERFLRLSKQVDIYRGLSGEVEVSASCLRQQASHLPHAAPS